MSSEANSPFTADLFPTSINGRIFEQAQANAGKRDVPQRDSVLLQQLLHDRGLAYGDGVFETIALRNGKVEFAAAHLDRMEKGCQRLMLSFPRQTLQTELQQFIKQLRIQQLQQGVLKIILTRGQGGRGYSFPQTPGCNRIISFSTLPEGLLYQQAPLNLVLGKTVLGESPSLAGLKHLNRLEQVIATHELDTLRQAFPKQKLAEILLCNRDAQLIEGSKTNVFLVRDRELYTPDLRLSGVEGVIRELILARLATELELRIRIEGISITQLAEFDEMFLCNSLCLIRPVGRVYQQQDTPDKLASYHLFSCFDISGKLQSALQRLLQTEDSPGL